MLLQTVGRFTSGNLSVEIVETTTDQAVIYGVTMIRRRHDGHLGEILFAGDMGELQDLIHTLGLAAGLIEHLLDGGSGVDWCRRAGVSTPAIAA